jgi:electron transport complex protein RnfC
MIVLVPDGLEQWRERHPLDPELITRQQILARIQDAGIAGMGGAGFPTHIKSSASQGVDYLIINAAECEPYITSDDMLMQTEADTILQGIDILCDLLSPKAVLIGIEDDKPRAIAAMQQACANRKDFYVRVVPAKYPSGGEKQLIQRLTSKEVPAGRRPLDIGIVMQNVGTAFAIAQAVLHDIPLISRIVTVVGETLSQPQNVLALLGTPVGFLLDSCGFAAEAKQRVIMGGPMMGFTLPSLQIPIVKTSNCIIAPSNAELPSAGPELDCIRCGACAEACPATLLPQQLLWFSKAKDHDKLKEHHLSDCIECGACAYVCPSEIPLVHYYRVAKAEIREQHRDELKAEQAKARFEARNERLEREKQERMAKNQALAAQRQSMLAEQQKQQIAQAASRVETTTSALSKEQIIAERERKKAEARAYQAAKAQQSITSESSPTEPPAVVQADTASHVPENSIDPRQSAVAAAIARAKAKKAASSAPITEDEAKITNPTTAEPTNATPSTEKPTATAAKLAEVASEQTPSADPRAAAVAAAIARAKAKKAATSAPITEDEAKITNQTTAEPTTATPSTEKPAATAAKVQEVASEQTPSADPRAAAVAAAIARAKAKKAATAGVNPLTSPDSIAMSSMVETATTENAAEQVKLSVEETQGEETQGEETQAEATVEVVPELATEIATDKRVAATEPTPELEVAMTASANADAKKAAIAAAIARAKAKKANDSDQEKSS